MLSGFDIEVVGIYDSAEQVCRKCAVKRYGEPFAGLVMLGLRRTETMFGPQPYFGWQANDDAYERGFIGGDEAEFDAEEATICCCDCGTRLDDGLVAAC